MTTRRQTRASRRKLGRDTAFELIARAEHQQLLARGELQKMGQKIGTAKSRVLCSRIDAARVNLTAAEKLLELASFEIWD